MVTTTANTAAARVPGTSLRRFGLLLQANLLMYVRERVGLFWVVIFPIILMLLFGTIWGNQPLNPNDPNSPTFISYLAPGLIVLSLMSNGLVGNATNMATYRERGILRRVQSTPLPIWQLMLAYIVMQTVVMVGQAALMIGVSIVVFQARYEGWGLLAAVPVVVLGAVTFMALGQAVAAVVRKVNTVNIVAQVINVPLMFLGGLWLPMSQLPEGLQIVGQFLLSTMLADLLRAALINPLYQDPNLPLLAGLAGVLVYFAGAVLIAVRFFKWQ
jgi:ABC-2 type transport system permease protein